METNKKPKRKATTQQVETPSQTLAAKMVDMNVAESELMQLESAHPTENNKKRGAHDEQAEQKDAKKPKVNAAADRHLTTELFPTDLQCYRALHENWKSMAEIQVQTLPHLLAGKDVEAQAKTGSGKTLAFLIPAVELAIQNETSNGVIAVILAPLRELAFQTRGVAAKLLRHHPGVKVHMLVGGYPVSKDKELLVGKKHIIIATPGRMNELLELGSCKFNTLKYFVLDEADHLLHPQNQRFVMKIREHVPKNCQTALFTATVTKAVKEHGNLKADAVVVSTMKQGDTNANKQVIIEYTVVQPKTLLGTLLAILREKRAASAPSVIVFCETVRVAEYLNLWAIANGINSAMYTSRLKQSERVGVFSSFRDKGGVLFASDIVARGADFPHVGLVVQLGVPQSDEIFLHRIGRTGRMGADGRALSILLPYQQGIIDKMKGKNVFPTKIDVLPVASVAKPDVDEQLKCRTLKKIISFIASNRLVKKACFESPEAVEQLKEIAYEVLGLPTHKCIDWGSYPSRGPQAPANVKEIFALDPAIAAARAVERQQAAECSKIKRAKKAAKIEAKKSAEAKKEEGEKAKAAKDQKARKRAAKRAKVKAEAANSKSIWKAGKKVRKDAAKSPKSKTAAKPAASKPKKNKKKKTATTATATA